MSILNSLSRKKPTLTAFAYMMEIGPTEAEELLKKNVRNRPVRRSTVIKYASDMKNGLFEPLNGQTIVVHRDGTLIDGQHRMSAVVESGVVLTFPVHVTDKKDVGERIDQGISRTLKDMLHMSSTVDADVMSSTIKLLYKSIEGADKCPGEYALLDWFENKHQELGAFWLSHKGLINGAHSGSDRSLPKHEVLAYAYMCKINQEGELYKKFMEFLAYVKEEKNGIKAPSPKFKWFLDTIKEYKDDNSSHKIKRPTRLAVIDYLCHLETGKLKGKKFGRVGRSTVIEKATDWGWRGWR
jgi:hypothetical protein